MPSPTWQPVDEPTSDLLSLIADDPRVDHEYQTFLDAAANCARIHNGLVYVNFVRDVLTNADGQLMIRPQRLSAFWNKASRDGHMVRTGDWDICEGSGSGNDGRPQPVRRWVA